MGNDNKVEHNQYGAKSKLIMSSEDGWTVVQYGLKSQLFGVFMTYYWQVMIGSGHTNIYRYRKTATFLMTRDSFTKLALVLVVVLPQSFQR